MRLKVKGNGAEWEVEAIDANDPGYAERFLDALMIDGHVYVYNNPMDVRSRCSSPDGVES